APTPAGPANVSGRPPRLRASASTSANTFPAAAPAMLGPAIDAAAAARAAAFLAHPASSTPVMSVVLVTSSPAVRMTSLSCRANPRSCVAITIEAPFSSTSAACDGPPSVATARAVPDLLGLLLAPAAEIDLEPGVRERDRETRSPRAGADDRGATDRGEAAEPLPLEHHARPDAVRDRTRELRRCVLDAREAQRA